MPDLDQIDREIALKIMGWERVYAIAIPMWKLPSGRWDMINWNPTRNIEQAFMVVEKMRELGWTFLIECDVVGFWNAVFAQGSAIISAQYDIHAEAICRASLKAVTEPTP